MYHQYLNFLVIYCKLTTTILMNCLTDKIQDDRGRIFKSCTMQLSIEKCFLKYRMLSISKAILTITSVIIKELMKYSKIFEIATSDTRLPLFKFVFNKETAYFARTFGLLYIIFSKSTIKLFRKDMGGMINRKSAGLSEQDNFLFW